MSRSAGIGWLLILMAGGASGQTPAPDAVSIAAGRILLTQLTGNDEADAALFRQVGTDRAQQLLVAVMDRGMNQDATLEDWTALHHAFAGLVSVEVFRENFAKAAAYAFLNEAYYRTHEHDYESALECARQALALDQKAGQPLYLVHKSIGEDLHVLGRPAEAMEEFRLAEAELPDPLDNTGSALAEDIFRTLLSAGKQDEAARQVEFMLSRTVAPPLYQGRAYLAQAQLFFTDGKYSEGIDASRKALAATAGTADAESCALEAAAGVATALLDGLSQLPYEQALEVAKLADTKLPELPVRLEPFAQSAIRQRRRLAGDLDAILREDIQRVDAARRGGDAAELGESLKSLAASYGLVNEMRQRALTLEEAAGIDRQRLPAGGATDDAALGAYFDSLNALGQTYIVLGQAGPAQKAFDTVIRHYASLTAASSLARLRSNQEEAIMGRADAEALEDDPDSARDTLTRLLRTVSASNRPYVYQEIGRLERNLNENPAAVLAAYRQAIDGFSAAHEYQPELAARLTLARYLATAALSRLPDAGKMAVEQISASDTIAAGRQYADAEWRIQYLRGVLLEEDHPADAIARYRDAIQKLDRIRSGLSQQEQRRSFFDNQSVKDLYGRLVVLLTRTGAREEAWRYVERAKARSFLETLQGRRFASDSAAPGLAGLQAIEKRMADMRFQLSLENERLLRAAGREPAALRSELKALEDRFALAREQAPLAQSRAGQILALQPPALADVQKHLEPREVLLEYALLDGSLTAFVVTTGGVEQIAWKADTNRLRQNVFRLRGLLANPESGDWRTLAGQISTVLITPVAAKFPPDTRTLLVAPAEYLNYLPLSVLSLPDGRLLIDQYAIGYLPNASALVYLGGNPSQNGKMFLGALGTSTVDGLSPLPGTLQETAGIAAVYPGATRVSGAAFTHDEARRALLSADIAHFATHGVMEPEAPLFSAILTSPAEGQPSRLSLYEIVGMKLRARMVVLSACETGLGTLRGGDEITGLTRTLLTAGADSVVASLWKVNDESTALLMAEFYLRLNSGMAPAAALRAASLEVRAKYPHPFYWGPFVVNGRN